MAKLHFLVCLLFMWHRAASAPIELYHPTLVHPPIASIYSQPALIKQIDAPAEYSYSYGVNDPHTGDIKSQEETRHGDVVKGSYSLVDSDGLRRIVHYTADPHNGFNAVVQRERIHAKVIAPVAAPINYQHVAPVQTLSHLSAHPLLVHQQSPYLNQLPLIQQHRSAYLQPLGLSQLAVPHLAAVNYGAPVLGNLALPSLAYSSHTHAIPSHVSVSTPGASYHY